MKHALPVDVVLALCVSVPALSQDEKPALETRIEVLEEIVAKQQEMLDAHVKTRDERGAELVRWLDVAEKKGFLYPAPNTDAKKALLAGLRAVAGPVKKPKTAKK